MPVNPRLLRYAARRLLSAIALVFLVSSGALLLAWLAPGDVTSGMIGAGFSAETIAAERARAGLDRPLGEQYASWLGRVVRLDFGPSLRYRRPVADLVRERAAHTALLALAAIALAIAVGLPLGVVSGSRRGPLVSLVGGASLVALSLPPLVMSLAFVLLAARTGWFPVGGMQSAGLETAGPLGTLADRLWHLALPAVALALPIAATIERLQARAIAETLAEPYVLAAMARGVPRGRLIWRHALRPALAPVAAVSGIVIGSLLGGSFAVEIVMAWPGLGRLMYDALVARDVYLVAGCAAAGAALLAAATFVSDLALATLDPRLRAI
jgi:peptide/nickel transport system permease protein